MIEISVDRKICQKHGQCIISGPDIFRFDAQGELQYEEHIEDSLAAQAEDSADVCPAQAIVIQ
ncbi:ferredoxin [Kocuria marina]|uniref:ferredoxin n=1 Tax=Kocuria marina TaxID=223184 RepID=UPI00345F3EC2